MPQKSITVSALNITMHPHSPQKYISLLKKAEKTKKAIRVSGDMYLQLVRGIFHVDLKNPIAGIYGDIAKFIDIPKDSQWLNLKTESTADEKDLEAISIPEDMKPNYTPFTFIFFPETHQFFYEQKNGKYQLSPNYVQKFLDGLFQLLPIQKEFGKVDVTVIPRTDKVNEILNIYDLKHLKLNITRPNPDDYGDDEDQRVLELLDSENVGTKIIENKAVKGKSIKPNHETKILAKIASRNGYVEGSGHDQQGTPVSDSTKAHPLKVSHTYDTTKVSFFDALYAAALKAKGKLFK